jgi:hypothetical protein
MQFAPFCSPAQSTPTRCAARVTGGFGCEG